MAYEKECDELLRLLVSADNQKSKMKCANDDRPLSLISTQDDLREYLVDNGYVKESGTTPKYTLTDKAKQL